MILRVLVALALLCSVAGAEDKPWATGVSEANQKNALGIYEAANGLFEQSQFKAAFDLYQQALQLWQHPAIYYNAAVCLVNLARPAEADAYFERALAFGPAPLGAEGFAEGEKYREDLKKQLANLEITIKEPGTSVTVDGERVLDKPGTTTRRLSVTDKHVIVAKKPGFQTESRSIKLVPGETTTLVLEMKLLEGSKWKPWAVVAVGGVIATVGGVLLAKSFDDYDRFDRAVTEVCPCMNHEEFVANALANPKTRGDVEADKLARLETIAAYSAFAVGGATIAAGLYFVLRNRGKATVTPTANSDRVGAVISVAF